MSTSKNILMIETKNGKKLFTHQKNLPMLIEFAKIFDAEIALVENDNFKSLDLETLAQAICERTLKPSQEQVKIVQRFFPKSK